MKKLSQNKNAAKDKKKSQDQIFKEGLMKFWESCEKAGIKEKDFINALSNNAIDLAHQYGKFSKLCEIYNNIGKELKD